MLSAPRKVTTTSLRLDYPSHICDAEVALRARGQSQGHRKFSALFLKL